MPDLTITVGEFWQCHVYCILTNKMNFQHKNVNTALCDPMVSGQLPPGQFAPHNSSLIFKQQVPRSFIHYRAKQVPKYVNPRLNVIQIILRSFIRYQTNYSSFFYPLPSLKIGGELSGVNCPWDKLSDIRSDTQKPFWLYHFLRVYP